MSFHNNISFGRPLCKCGRPDTGYSSRYGYICLDCYSSYRWESYFEEHEVRYCTCVGPTPYNSPAFGWVCGDCLETIDETRGL
jgi:hypothetical protein